MASTRWCFTLNNYSLDHEDTLKAVPSTYLVYGKEKGDSGTPHLQGFIIFPKPKRLSALKKIDPTAHWEAAKGTSQQAADYCKKEGDFYEVGTFPSSSGKRSDLVSFQDLVKSGVTDTKRLREEMPEVMAKYPRYAADYIRDQAPVPVLPDHPLRPWQEELSATLALPPDDRTVVFIVDETGNAGKSWFAKRYTRDHSDAFLMRPGKHADMAYVVPPMVRVLFLDCTRTQVEFMPYTFLEELKDGYVMSTKYECCQKTYEKMHVVVLMNQFPDMEKLSADRYDVRDIRTTPIWNPPDSE